jgi:hypothetical protein
VEKFLDVIKLASKECMIPRNMMGKFTVLAVVPLVLTRGVILVWIKKPSLILATRSLSYKSKLAVIPTHLTQAIDSPGISCDVDTILLPL